MNRRRRSLATFRRIKKGHLLREMEIRGDNPRNKRGRRIQTQTMITAGSGEAHARINTGLDI
jgi:hypothetical protein